MIAKFGSIPLAFIVSFNIFRRIRPTETPDVLNCGNVSPVEARTPESSAVNTKKKKMEAETQTESNVYAIKMQAPNAISSGNARNSENTRNSEGTFKNERDSGGMPLILNVFSLSAEGSLRATKQVNTLSKQANGFPVTPPCSPPLVQLGPFQAIPVMGRNSQVRPKNTNPCGFSADNFGAQTVQGRNSMISADARMQHVYKHLDPMANTSSHLIANGVLPVVEHNNYGQYAYAGDNSQPSGYFNSYGGGNNSGKSPILQLTSTFSLGNKYLVPKESFVTKESSGMFTRFKLQRSANASENRPPNVNVPSMAGEFSQTTPKSTGQLCIDPKNDEYRAGGSSRGFACLLQRASVTQSQKNGRSEIVHGTEVCSSSNNRVVMPTDNQKNYSQSYPGFRQGYDQTQHTAVSTNGNLYLTRVPITSKPAPCAPSKEQISEIEQSQWSSASSGDERSEFLSPRDARVKKLKKLLEEQEAKLNRLRTSH